MIREPGPLSRLRPGGLPRGGQESIPPSRHHGFGHFAANIDQCAPVGFQVQQNCHRPVIDSPKVDLEQPARVPFADLLQTAVDGNAGVIHPCVDGSKILDGVPAQFLYLISLRDIAMEKMAMPPLAVISSTALCVAALLRAARTNAGAPSRRQLCRGQPDATRCSRDRNYLFINRF